MELGKPLYYRQRLSMRCWSANSWILIRSTLFLKTVSECCHILLTLFVEVTSLDDINPEGMNDELNDTLDRVDSEL